MGKKVKRMEVFTLHNNKSCLVGWLLNIPVNSFSVMSGCSFGFLGIIQYKAELMYLTEERGTGVTFRSPQTVTTRLQHSPNCTGNINEGQKHM